MPIRAYVTAIAIAAITGVACESATPAAPAATPAAPVATPASPSPSPGAQDALWALAPAGMKLGVIATPHALAAFEHGATAIESLVASTPELASVTSELSALVFALAEGRDDGSLDRLIAPPSTYGVTTDEGLAAFATSGGELAVLPVADRAAFVRFFGGRATPDGDAIGGYTCRPVGAVYACGKPAAMLDQLGTGKLADPVALVGERGELELSANVPLAGSASATLAAVGQVSPGAIVLRAAMSAPSLGVPPELRARLGTSFRPRVDPASTAGFGVIDLAHLFGPDGDMTGIAPSDLAGPLTVSVPAGTFAFDLRLPFHDPAAARALLARCGTAGALVALGATFHGGVCRVAIPAIGVELEGRVSGAELRVAARGTPSSPAPVALTGVGRELATGTWAFAAYGRGTELAMQPPADASGEAAMLRLTSLLDEIGVGIRLDGDVVRGLATVRTAWANPDAVVAKLLAIPPADLAGGKARATARAIAAAAPGSPFAADLRAGAGGLAVPALLLADVAAGVTSAYVSFLRGDSHRIGVAPNAAATARDPAREAALARKLEAAAAAH